MEHIAGERNGAALRRVGERLAAEREAQGVALADVAQRTRIPLRSLETIEGGGSAGLPALTYSAGFVRSYASALGLDGAEYARQFREEMGRVPQPVLPEAYALADPARVPSRLLAIVALVVAVLIAGGYAIWRGDGLFGGGAEDRARLAAGTEATPAATPATGAPPATMAPPTPLANAPAAAAPAADGPVVIAAKEPVWLKVYERDGRTLYLDTMKAGDRFEVPATAVDPLIRTGRTQALTITVGGTAVPAIGPPDTLVKDRSLKRAALIGGGSFALPVATPTAGSGGGTGGPAQ